MSRPTRSISASPFSTIRVDPSSRGLRYSEPLSGFSSEISAEELAAQRIQLESFPPRSKRRLAEASKWWRRGWNKPLDLLLASRVTRRREGADSTNPQLLAECPERLYRTHQGRRTIKLPLSGVRRQDRQGDLEAALIRRKSVRSFSGAPMTLPALADILGGLYGPRNESLFPDVLQYVYSVVFVFGVKGVVPGMYLYSPTDHALRSIRSGNYRRTICRIVSGMPSAKTATFAVLFCADVIPFIASRGTERALRDLYFVLGIISQRLLVGASRFGLMGVVSPALQDRFALRQTNALDQAILPIYSAVLGWPKGEAGRASHAG